jgi:hypothetical protein
VPTVFFSYSHHDEALRDQLEKQLSMLKRQGIIDTWHDRRIGAGEEIDGAIDEHINKDDIILLLVSSDFLASSYCYDVEMKRALERHDKGEAIVIPVILRACDWHAAPFGKLNATPPDGKPITKWADRDEAFLEVVKAVRGAAARFAGQNSKPVSTPTADRSTAQQVGPRSSNLRIAKTFSERDKDVYKVETFEFMARFFENSLEELTSRNPGIEGHFRRVDSDRFFATIYQNGAAKARCTVFMAGSLLGSGICYVSGETTASNSMNTSLQVEADDQAMYLCAFGMSLLSTDNARLSQDGASELYWQLLIRPLQRQ